MKYKLATTAGVVTVALVASLLSVSGVAHRSADAATVPAGAWNLDDYGPRSDAAANDDVVLKWNQQILDTISANPAATGPTVAARLLGEVHTSIYDAWAAYDPTAKWTQKNNNVRQPTTDATTTLQNKSKAISFAAYTTLVDLFPSRIDTYKTALGYSVDDPSTPAQIGRNAAQANINFRRADGSNQTNNANNSVTYPCPGCYNMTNPWGKQLTATNPDRWHWQQLCMLTQAGLDAHLTSPDPPGTDDCSGTYYTKQSPTTPQWGSIKPFASLTAPLAGVPSPPKNVNGAYSTADIQQAYTDTSNLTDAAKAKAEYWADGPKSVFPPGHTMIFAQALSRRRGFSLDTNVNLFFALGTPCWTRASRHGT